MVAGTRRYVRPRRLVASKPIRRLAAAVALAVLAGCSTRGASDGSTSGGSAGSVQGADSVGLVGVTSYPLQSRQDAPALVGQTLAGESLSLASIGQGKVVLLNIWASWCGPCRSESPMLAAAAKSFAPDGVAFLGIDEQDVESSARTFVSSTGMTYPNLVDKEGALLRKLKMLPQAGIPSTLLLDRHGRIAARVIGPITSTEVTDVVRKLIAES